MRKLIPISTPTPVPSPSPSQFLPIPHSFFQPIPTLDSAFDAATLSLIACLLLLSALSLSFIFYLRLKSRTSYHLQNFNSLWFVRLLFVLFVLIWSLDETLRLPFLRRRYLPGLTSSQQSGLCKIHVVLSLGLLQPGFLTTLLFLLNVSVKKTKNPLRPICVVLLACTPVTLLQAFFVYFAPFDSRLPDIFYTSSVSYTDSFDKQVVMCRYPLFSMIVFAAFGIGYSFGFLFSYWRVVSLVINKGTRVMIHALAFSVLMCLPIQVLFLALSSFWPPGSPAYGGLMLGMFVSVSSCAAVGEGILVIRPVADALAAGGDCCRWKPGGAPWSRPAEEGRREAAAVVEYGR